MANNPSAQVGKRYRAVFSYPSGMPPAQVNVPKELSVKVYGITLLAWNVNQVARELTIEFIIQTGASSVSDAAPSINARTSATFAVAPIAVGAGTIILAALAVLGLSMVYLTLSKVEEIVDSPTGSVFSLGVVAIAGVVLYLFLKGR